MARFYFDTRDAEGQRIDEEGHDFPDLAAVQWEAVLTLVDQSRSTREGLLTDVTIDVRDDAGPVMKVTFKFEKRLRP